MASTTPRKSSSTSGAGGARGKKASSPKGPDATKSWPRRILKWALWAMLAGFLLFAAGFAYLWFTVDIPEPNAEATSQTSIVLYADGAKEIGRFADENRVPVPIERIPLDLQHAVVSAEDRTFYTNIGISPRGMLRAFINNVTGGQTQGASTITQQYVKNYYLTADRTLSRKIQEIVISLKVDATRSKDQILEDYLNTIYFGRSAWGVQTASQAYFGKKVDDLDLQQAATLASILRSPGLYDPKYDEGNAERLEERVTYVLQGMEDEGWAPSGSADSLTAAEVKERSAAQAYAGPKGYLLDTVRRELLAQGFEEAEIDAGGLRIVTTFEKQAQDSAVKAMREEFPTTNIEGVYAGLAAVRPGTGEVVAMYGGKDYLDRQQNDATESAPQAGSTVKAFTVATALQEDIALESGFAGNSPLEVPGSKPVNNEFDQDYGSLVSLTKATEQSINTAFVDLTMQVGPEKVLDTMVEAGIPEPCPTDGSDAADPCTPGLLADARITLGTASITPMQMANGFATLAAEGQRADWHTVGRVKSASGEVVYEWEGKPTDAIDADIANETTYALTRVVTNGTGRNAGDLGRPAAGKTGTAEDLSAWFAGYTPQLAAAVGFYRETADGGQASLDGVGGLSTFFGGEYPTRIWTAFMKGALDGMETEQFPDRPENLGATKSPIVTPVPTTSPRPTTTAPVPTVEPTVEPTIEPTPEPTPDPPGPTPTGNPNPTNPGNGNGGGNGGGGGPTAPTEPTPGVEPTAGTSP